MAGSCVHRKAPGPAAQTIPDHPTHVLVDEVLIQKPHVPFGGMHIHIHPGRIHIQKQDEQRVPPFRQEGSVGVVDGVRDGGVLMNQTPPFDEVNPTAELVAKNIAESVSSRLGDMVHVNRVSVTEAPGCEATYFMPSDQR